MIYNNIFSSQCYVQCDCMYIHLHNKSCIISLSANSNAWREIFSWLYSILHSLNPSTKFRSCRISSVNCRTARWRRCTTESKFIVKWMCMNFSLSCTFSELENVYACACRCVSVCACELREWVEAPCGAGGPPSARNLQVSSLLPWLQQRSPLLHPSQVHLYT